MTRPPCAAVAVVVLLLQRAAAVAFLLDLLRRSGVTVGQLGEQGGLARFFLRLHQMVNHSLMHALLAQIDDLLRVEVVEGAAVLQLFDDGLTLCAFLRPDDHFAQRHLGVGGRSEARQVLG